NAALEDDRNRWPLRQGLDFGGSRRVRRPESPHGERELREARGVDLSEERETPSPPTPLANGEGRAVAGRRSLPGQASGRCYSITRAPDSHSRSLRRSPPYSCTPPSRNPRPRS